MEEVQSGAMEVALGARALEAAPFGCVVLDANERLIFANESARSWSDGELSPSNLWGRQSSAVLELAQEAATIGCGVARTFTDPVSQWEVSAVPIGHAVALYYRHRRRDGSSQALEARFRQLLWQCPLSVQILDLDGRTLWVNQAYSELWGARLDDLASYNVLQDPQLAELGLAPLIARAVRGEVIQLPARRYDASRITQGGQIRYARAMAFPIRDVEGNLVEVVLIDEDLTDAAKSAEKLARQEGRTQAVLTGIGAAQWEQDLITDEVVWSPELYGLLNLPPDAKPNLQRFVQMIHPMDREAALREFNRARVTNSSINMEFRVQVPGRGVRWFASIGRVVPGVGGSARMVGINIDVTDQVTLRQTLERTERSLSLAMKGGRMGYWTRQFSGDEIVPTDRVEWSPELEEVFGLEPGTFGGTEAEFLALVHPEDLPELQNAVADAVRDRTDYMVQFRYLHGDGSWRWMEGRGRATYDGEHVVRLDGIGIDITLQKRAEEERSELEQRFRRLADLLPALVWSTTGDGHTEYMNQAWSAFTGYRMEDFLRLGIGAIVHPEDLDSLMRDWRTAREQVAPFRKELRYRRYDGEYRWFLVSVTPFLDEAGRLISWFGTASDINAQKDAAAELESLVRERTRELEDVNRELEGFTYSVSHDLRGPLRAIMATSMILLQEAGIKLDEEERRMLERQAHNANRLGRLIDDLLQMSRLGRQEIHKSPIDLASLAREIVEESSRILPEHRVEIPDQLPAVGDATLIRFVLENLIDNAAKFSPKGGRIMLGATIDGRYFVRDEGVGFDPAFTHKLFRPFERLVHESEFPGTGIGLANVRRIVERHGGHIHAESTPGQGSTFYFSLPGS